MPGVLGCIGVLIFSTALGAAAFGAKSVMFGDRDPAKRDTKISIIFGAIVGVVVGVVVIYRMAKT